jgi:hypothetical protein
MTRDRYDDDRPGRDRYDEDDFDDRPRGSNPIAIVSLVLGVLSFFCSFATGAPAIICGVVGLAKANKTGVGKGLSIAGIVLGGSAGILSAFLWIGLMLPAVQAVRGEAARKTSSNTLKQIGLGAHNYEATSGEFPTAYHRVNSNEGVPAGEAANRLSWRFTILPYVEQQPLYAQYSASATQPWNSPANRPLATTTVKTYVDPIDAPSSDTRYRVLVGPGTLFDPAFDRGVKFQEITDGSSNTIFAVETADLVPWPQNKELTFSPNGPFPAVGHPARDGVLVMFADASVRSVRKSNTQTLKAAATRNGSEVVAVD